MDQQLILVDDNDQVIGYGEKMEVHEKALLHRAFSIFIVNSKNELLLQKRELSKYHSGGLWANTCCSHPIKGEDQMTTVHRRLQEELGIHCELQPVFSFIYQANLDNGLTEYEFDHVYLGRFEGAPEPNPEEVGDWKWMNIKDLNEDLKENPDEYVYWIRPAFEKFYEYFQASK